MGLDKVLLEGVLPMKSLSMALTSLSCMKVDYIQKGAYLCGVAAGTLHPGLVHVIVFIAAPLYTLVLKDVQPCKVSPPGVSMYSHMWLGKVGMLVHTPARGLMNTGLLLKTDADRIQPYNCAICCIMKKLL